MKLLYGILFLSGILAQDDAPDKGPRPDLAPTGASEQEPKPTAASALAGDESSHAEEFPPKISEGWMYVIYCLAGICALG